MEKAGGLNRSAAGDPAPMVHYLRSAADHVDRCMSGHEHSSAISRWAAVLSRSLGHDPTTTWRLELAGRLHDIGKIVVPEAILNKPGGLTAEEWDLLRRHPDHGARMARLVPGFGAVAETIRQHHERFDGTGYPNRLRGTDIRVESRIIAVCDSWAAMRSDRAYQPALPEDRAREQLHAGRNTQFDPELVDLFLELHDRGQIGGLELLSAPAPV
jgi:two-component system, cell cycle response regulator